MRGVLFAAVWLSALLATFAVAEQRWDGEEDASPQLDSLPVVHTAFVQTGDELHFFSESTSYESGLFSGGRQPDHRSNRKWSARTGRRDGVEKEEEGEPPGEQPPLVFEPNLLEFDEQSVGVASPRRVKVRANVPIRLDAILGSTVSFHASFFDHKELLPGDEAYFEVAFLAREIGRVANVLMIHTSEGIFAYELIGRGTSNPYRLPPFLGTPVPIMATLEREIVLHNPHEYTLRVREIASSCGDVHIELPFPLHPHVIDEPAQHWDIRPYQTRSIGRMVMVGARESNTTSFVRINTMLLVPGGEAHVPVPRPAPLMIPFPVEVTRRKGVFSTQELLDFGLLRLGEKSKQLTFSVYSSLHKNIEIETLYVDRGDSSHIYMQFSSNPPIHVNGANRQGVPGKPSALVEVVFDTSRVQMKGAGSEGAGPATRTLHGRIIAVSRGGNYNVTIPYTATVYRGDMAAVGDDMCVHCGLSAPAKRGVRLVNRLPFGVAVWNVTLAEQATNHFTVRLFAPVTVIAPGDMQSVFLLKYNKRAPAEFTSTLTVATNVTTYKLPIKVYDGKVKVVLSSLDQKTFDFGYLERNDSRTIRFSVVNDNPAVVSVRSLRVPYPEMSRLYMVKMAAMGACAAEGGAGSYDEWPQGRDLDVPAHSEAVLDMQLRAPLAPFHGDEGELRIDTDWEARSYPIIYHLVEQGRLTSIPDQLAFGKSHPGKVSFRNLQVFNSFDEDMRLLRVSSLQNDERLQLEGAGPAGAGPVLRSGRLTSLGRVLFMPRSDCNRDDCYLGIPLHTSDGQWFVHGLTLPANLPEIDSYLYKRVRAKFDSLVENGRHRVNTTLVLDTDKAKGVRVPATAEMVWPRLLTRNSIHFPLTALGNFTIVNLTLANPSALPVIVQIIPLVIYPDAEAVVDLFREHLITPLTSHVEMNETLMFSLRDTELFTLKPDSPVPKLREELEEVVRTGVPRFTLSMILKPHAKVRVRLGFLPSDYTLRSSLLLIRNNLTAMEPVVVYGRGARIGMEVEGSAARSKTPLLFEIRHDHLADCHNPKRQLHKLLTTLTVRRPFTVKNVGEVPFHVVNMSISGVPCENRGFRILNCYPFRLLPNETYALDVAYTPDFLSTINEADLQLYMHMNGSAWLFPLAATVPANMMIKCHSALPRPPFETLMYYSCLLALIFCVVCLIACAYLEADRAISCAIRQSYAQQRPVFDLNAAATSGGPPAKAAAGAGANPSLPSVAEDASWVVRVGCAVANRVLAAVHSLWRLSLLYRSKPEEKAKVEGSRKKKEKKRVGSVWKMKEKEQEEQQHKKKGGKEKEEAKRKESAAKLVEEKRLQEVIKKMDEEKKKEEKKTPTPLLKKKEKTKEQTRAEKEQREREREVREKEQLARREPEPALEEWLEDLPTPKASPVIKKSAPRMSKATPPARASPPVCCNGWDEGVDRPCLLPSNTLRSPSDDEMSLAPSELSCAPEWVDEIVADSDEGDLSDLAAAAQALYSGANSRSSSPMPMENKREQEQKKEKEQPNNNKKANKKKRGGKDNKVIGAERDKDEKNKPNGMDWPMPSPMLDPSSASSLGLSHHMGGIPMWPSNFPAATPAPPPQAPPPSSFMSLHPGQLWTPTAGSVRVSPGPSSPSAAPPSPSVPGEWEKDCQNIINNMAFAPLDLNALQAHLPEGFLDPDLFHQFMPPQHNQPTQAPPPIAPPTLFSDDFSAWETEATEVDPEVAWANMLLKEEKEK